MSKSDVEICCHCTYLPKGCDKENKSKLPLDFATLAAGIWVSFSAPGFLPVLASFLSRNAEVLKKLGS